MRLQKGEKEINEMEKESVGSLNLLQVDSAGCRGVGARSNGGTIMAAHHCVCTFAN